MIRKYFISFLFPLLAMFVSCADETLQNCEGGYVDLNVIHDTSVEIVPVTKAEGEDLPIALVIVDEQGNIDYENKDFRRVTTPIRLNTGKYTATATAGAESGTDLSEVPFYSGSVTFDVKPNAVSTVELSCKLTSVKVTAVVDDAIKSNFDYLLEVTNGKANVTFQNDLYSDEKEYYFSATGKLSWVMTLTNNQGETFILSDSYVSVKPHQHYALAFSLEEGTEDKIGAGEFNIIVDNALNDPKVHDVTLVIDKSAPSISGQTHVTKGASDVYSGADYIVSSTLPFSSMVIRHSDTALSSAGLPEEMNIYDTPSHISTLAGLGVNVAVFANGYAQQTMDETTTDVKFNFDGLLNNLPVGTYNLTLSTTNLTLKEQVMNLVFEVTSSVPAPVVQPWSEFIYVKYLWTTSAYPSDLKLQYRQSSSADWTDFVPSETAGELFINEDTKTAKAFICALQGATSYEVRLVTSKEATTPVAATTASSEQLYNMNFDEWDGNYTPYASGKGGVWDTANPGTEALSIYPTSRETSDVISGSAVRMKSMYKMKFAAGNIYTGRFGKAIINLSNPGAELYWGLPFTVKPVGLKGWYKYQSATINRTEGDYGHLKGQQDKGQVLFGLFTNWTSQFHIKTNVAQFVDFSENNHDIVATNAILTDTTEGWVNFTMYAGYRKENLNKAPTYIVTTACASYKGDYFTGGEGSTLLIDEFAYIYDPMELSADDRAQFFSLFD